MNGNLFATVSRRSTDGGRPFLVTEAGRVFTYADLLAWSGRFANALAALGVKPGDRVAIFAATSLNWVITDLAINAAGAITVPIYASNTPDECRYILNNSESVMLFVDNEFPEKKESGRFLILGEAKGEKSELLATVTILHRTWQPGTYACNEDTQVAFGLSDHWNPAAEDTYVSWQPGANCQLSLQEGQQPGDLEGSLRGTFVTNAGSHKIEIEAGYLYIKQFQ